jgi:hypothetical protein
VTQPSPLDQIDLLLQAWDERLRRMDENLVALESEAIYQILAGKAGKRPALEGVTKERVGPALDAVTELFENRERLGAVVAKAKEVRASISAIAFWDKDEKIHEVQRLLQGPSIELGQKVVSLAQRNLLDQSYRDVMVDPEQLLAQMAARFQEARTVLLAVSRAWEALDATMAAVEGEMTALRALAHQLGAKDTAELADAEAELARLRTRTSKDPLGAHGGIEHEVEPRLAALRARLDALGAARGRVQSALDVARELERRLAGEHERAAERIAEAQRELAGESARRLAPPTDDALLSGLAPWLAKIEGTIAAGRWSSAEVGLTRWRATAEQYLANDEAARAAADALLGRRGELQGRLSARRAQAAALVARGLALDPSLEAKAKEAEALLRARPLSLESATHAVEAYEAGVVALAALKRVTDPRMP